MSLCARLKAATSHLHTALERHAWTRALLAAQVPTRAYARHLASLHQLYAALERSLERQAAHPALASLPRAALVRTPALARDLQVWSGGAATAPVPAAAAYAAWLERLAAEAPARLLAHVYTRHLGDLHGGQALAARVRVLAARAGLAQPEAAAAFHELGDRADVAARIVALRAALDAAVPDAAEADAVVAEAVHAFELHLPLFDQLAAACDAAAAPHTASQALA